MLYEVSAGVSTKMGRWADAVCLLVTVLPSPSGTALSIKHAINVKIHKAGVVCMPVACGAKGGKLAGIREQMKTDFVALWCKENRASGNGECPLRELTVEMTCHPPSKSVLPSSLLSASP